MSYDPELPIPTPQGSMMPEDDSGDNIGNELCRDELCGPLFIEIATSSSELHLLS